MKKLSIIIPVYNECITLPKVVERVQQVRLDKIEKEIIIVDDGSTDGTIEVLKNIKGGNIKKIFHPVNRGKGAAVRSGVDNSTGDIVIIQDADLEYNPDEYSLLIQPILNGKEKVVYGSRTLGNKIFYSHLSFRLGGQFVTWLTNLLFFSNLTDEPTCYKTFKSDVIKSLQIKGNRFEWEPEITAKVIKKGIHIHEVPISYSPRKLSEGKKIKWRDGIIAILTLLRYRFTD